MLTAGISLLSPLATFKANSDSHSSSNNSGITSPTVQYPGKSVAGLQMREKSQPNEILVTSLFDPNDSAEYAVEPLNDSNLLYAIIRSQTEEEVSKVVTITSLEKRVRYNGGAHEEELHQHVRYDEMEQLGSKGPKNDQAGRSRRGRASRLPYK
ncbi:hypothetical protein FRB96_007414 [Tulasnella sp. 330]|nr:hypothetical protein FRB96_007414 [Tulasnella sp. 330]